MFLVLAVSNLTKCGRSNLVASNKLHPHRHHNNFTAMSPVDKEDMKRISALSPVQRRSKLDEVQKKLV